MLRITVAAIAILATLLPAGPARADWHEFWHRFKLDRRRMNCWPEPFIGIDRNLTRTPIERMVVKGWMRQNTLGDHHFQPESHVLNEAGQLKIRWILTTAPMQHRQILVQRAVRPEDSEARLDSVQKHLAKTLPDQALPPVIPTDQGPPGWPADYVDAIGRSSMQNLPAPILPAAGGISGAPGT